ncbi:MAG: DUF58 domain-containing protein [Clostridia bacterium]|nr:DUF58 domain-containing protein [Clostridia bacterium]
MPFSRLFAALLAAGSIPIIISGFFGGAFYVFIAYNVLLAALIIIDFIITPKPKELELERVCGEKFSLGVYNEVVLKVRNNSKYILDVELRDEIPPFFKIKEYIIRAKAIPHDDCEGKYYVLPEKRGEFGFGKVYCRYNGILKLCSKKASFSLQKNYKVYPNLKDLSKFGLAAIKKSQLALGMKKSKSYSIGTEFESLREYAKGDDYRKINWLATARSDKLIVNTFEPEKNQQVFVMLDSSRVMNSEINYIKKLDYSINSAFVLADVVIRSGDNVGLMVFDSEVKRYIKPGKGPSHFQLIAENLYNVQENFVTADYEGALLYLNEQQKRRSLLCIFTELFNADEAMALVKSLKSISRNHVPLVITIKDMRLYHMMDCKVKTDNDVFLKSASIKLIEEREKISKIFKDSGIACLDIPPDKLSIEVANKYLTMKSMMQI